MSPLSKVEKFRKSKAGTYLSIGTSLFGLVGVVKQVRSARGEGDKLRLVDAMLTGAAVVTGVALLVRDLRDLDSDDILAG